MNDISNEQLSAYLDDELSPAARARAQSRLEAEPTLQKALEALRLTASLLSAAPIVPLPRNFTLNPSAYRRRPPWFVRFGAIRIAGAAGMVAALVLIVFGLLFSSSNNAPAYTNSGAVALFTTPTQTDARRDAEQSTVAAESRVTAPSRSPVAPQTGQLPTSTTASQAVGAAPTATDNLSGGQDAQPTLQFPQQSNTQLPIGPGPQQSTPIEVTETNLQGTATVAGFVANTLAPQPTTAKGTGLAGAAAPGIETSQYVPSPPSLLTAETPMLLVTGTATPSATSQAADAVDKSREGPFSTPTRVLPTVRLPGTATAARTVVMATGVVQTTFVAPTRNFFGTSTITPTLPTTPTTTPSVGAAQNMPISPTAVPQAAQVASQTVPPPAPLTATLTAAPTVGEDARASDSGTLNLPARFLILVGVLLLMIFAGLFLMGTRSRA